jgi:S1-C subfamily serine protease
MKSRKEVETLADALGGMPVWGVLDGSVAARAGIRYGDVVLEVNGLKTPDARAFLEARDLRQDGSRGRAPVRRGAAAVDSRHHRSGDPAALDAVSELSSPFVEAELTARSAALLT